MSKISTQKAELTLLEKNIVRISVRNDVYLEEEDVIEIIKAKSSLIKHNYYRVLHVCGINSNMSKEAREIWAHKDHGQNQIAKAIIINSLAQKIVGNFFIHFNKPSNPTKLFKTEGEALHWLNEFIE